MKDSQDAVNVSILGKQFTVACPEEEREELRAAAEYMDRKMRGIQESGKVIGLERCAIMAALNISHELLALQQDVTPVAEVETKLVSLQNRIEAALREQSELEL